MTARTRGKRSALAAAIGIAILAALTLAAGSARPRGPGRVARAPGQATARAQSPAVARAHGQAPVRAQSPAASAPGPCDPGSPAADLYCMLLTPVPELRDIVEAHLELGLAPGPFGAPVTDDGSPRYQPTLVVRGLPEPATLGPYSAYVAWVAAPTLYPIHKLGSISNGATTLPAIDMNEFLVLVSAERSGAVNARGGRIVLRGFSPSTRLQPPDVYDFAYGSGAPDTGDAGTHAGAHSHDEAAGAWPRPPMPPRIEMLPALMQLAPPDATPYLPQVADPGSVPYVRPRSLVRLEDGDTLDLDARYVRQRLRGREFIAYGFNGMVPGPLIDVPRGSEIVVRFTNSIDWPTTVHWHGVRIENRYDGVPHVTQEPVQPGETFTYRVRFRDGGIFWYHPHHREDVLKELGLYGNILVRQPQPDYWSPANREEVLVLDDFLMHEGGPVPFGLERATHALMGRFGNVYLINGEPEYRLSVRRGEVVRFYFTNVSNTRTFNIRMPGARMKVVGSDIGGFEREAWVESVVIAPAERYVVHARFDEPGAVPIVNHVQAIDHLYGEFFEAADTLGRIDVDAARAQPDHATTFDRLRDNAHVAADIAPYRRYFDAPVDRELVLAMETDGLPFVVDRLMTLDSVYFNPVEWSGTMPMMNWASTTDQVRWFLRDPETGRENLDIDWRFDVGDVVKLRLRNERRVLHGMQHPIHIHGQRFLVLSVNGTPNRNLAWKDTILLPAGATADLLLEISNPGRWMIHCHISEHLEAGMRMLFTALPAG